MDPQSGESKQDGDDAQRDDSVFPLDATPTVAEATAPSNPRDSPLRQQLGHPTMGGVDMINNEDPAPLPAPAKAALMNDEDVAIKEVAKMAHLSNVGVAVIPPPLPEAQTIMAAVEGVDAAIKKPVGGMDVIDNDNPAPAKASLMNDEDAAIKEVAKMAHVSNVGVAVIPPPLPEAQTIMAAVEGEDAAIKKPGGRVDVIKGDLKKSPTTVTQAEPNATVPPLAASLNQMNAPTQTNLVNALSPPAPSNPSLLVEDGADAKTMVRMSSRDDSAIEPEDTWEDNQRVTTRARTRFFTIRGNRQVNGGTSSQNNDVEAQASRPSSASNIQASSDISFHLLEARPVEEEEPAPVYDATIVQTEEEHRQWKKNRRYISLIGMVLLLVVAVVVMGTLLGSRGSSDDGTAKEENGGTVLRGPTESKDESGGTVLKGSAESNSITFEAEEQTKNSTVLLDSNNTFIGPADPSSDESPPVSPSEFPTAKPTSNDPTFEPTISGKLDSITSSQTKLLPNDVQVDQFGRAVEQFGRAVAVDGNTVVVGAPYDDSNGNNIGSAYIFIHDGDEWIQQAKLLPEDGRLEDYFGSSVGICNDTVVVGAYQDYENGIRHGAVYIFVLDGGEWIQQAKLLPEDGAAGDFFGRSVAISEGTVVVGADGDDDNGSMSGAAYIFVQDEGEWIQQAKLLPDDGGADDLFGYAVSVSKDTVIVGAYQDYENGCRHGSAYIYVRDGDEWSQQARLLPDDGTAGRRFGYAVAVSGSNVVVGALRDHDNGNQSGSAYIYIRNGDEWVQQAKLLPEDGDTDDQFGVAVAVDENTVVVGSWFDDDNGSRSGSAYIWNRDGDEWIQRAKLLPEDGAAGDFFGRSVAVSETTVVVGAYLDDNGSAYAFLLQQ